MSWWRHHSALAAVLMVALAGLAVAQQPVPQCQQQGLLRLGGPAQPPYAVQLPFCERYQCSCCNVSHALTIQRSVRDLLTDEELSPGCKAAWAKLACRVCDPQVTSCTRLHRAVAQPRQLHMQRCYTSPHRRGSTLLCLLPVTGHTPQVGVGHKPLVCRPLCDETLRACAEVRRGQCICSMAVVLLRTARCDRRCNGGRPGVWGCGMDSGSTASFYFWWWWWWCTPLYSILLLYPFCCCCCDCCCCRCCRLCCFLYVCVRATTCRTFTLTPLQLATSHPAPAR